MWEILSWILIFAVLGGLIIAGAWYYKTQMSSGQGSSGLFGSRPEKRLGVVEQSNVDGRRKLVLIRRDGTEHLIMTGGPVDVVIETNIGDQSAQPAQVQPAQAQIDDTSLQTPVYSRNPRHLGKAV